MVAIPGMLQSGLMRVIEHALNRVLRLDPATPERLAPLAGRTLAVRLVEPAVALRVYFESDGLRLLQPDERAADDAELEATAAGLAALALSRGERSRDVTFRGDVGVIQETRRLVAELDVDWEEQLAGITGDIVAHQVGRGVRGGRDWLRHGVETFITNLGEYVTEERGLIPPLAEMEAFIADVDRLRTDSDRLEARIRRLERARVGEGGA